MGAESYRDLATEQLAEHLGLQSDLPRHVAIIMDGNGRWARRRFLPRAAGHRAGRHSVRAAVSICGRLGIDVLTLYTFSQENFSRPEAEVQALWTFLEEALVVEQAELRERGVRLAISGEVGLLPARAREALDTAVRELSTGDGLILNLALAYGGRQEVVQAARKLARQAAAGELDADHIDEAALRRELYHPELPDPDLVIRTSGESRLSNFLIWQAAYAELLVTPVLWPDFRERELLLAIADFLGRERRFGGLPEAAAKAGGKRESSVFDPARWKRLLGNRS